MGCKPNWTKEEIEYLQENWGTLSVSKIAEHLDRNENAVLQKKRKLGLGAFLDSGDYITWHQLQIFLGMPQGDSYKRISWIKNRNFPIKKKRVNNCSFKIVYIDDFWKWAEKNKAFIDLSKMEENVLGKEPEWVKDKRKRDVQRKQQYITTPWTKSEDEKLKRMVKQQKYSYAELSREMRRTCGAIAKRLSDLGIKDRPVKADNHSKWTDTETDMLKYCVKQGYTYEDIAEVIEKSTKAIRGRVYKLYGTENIDKINSKGRRLGNE